MTYFNNQLYIYLLERNPVTFTVFFISFIIILYLMILLCYYIFFIIITFLMFNNRIDLNIFINYVVEVHQNLGIILVFFLISLWLLFFVILIMIRKILIKEVIKCYLSLFFYYGYFKSKYYNFIYRNKYIEFNWARREVSYYIWKIIKYVIIFSNYKYKNNLIDKIGQMNTLYQTLLILVILFGYDCYFNHLIISKVFYYLPFYFIYNLWYRIKTFLDGNNRSLNQVIYERYYQTNDIVYMGTTDEEEESLKAYIRKGFKYEYTLLDLEELIPSILYYRRYVRKPNSNEFYNVETGEGTIIEDLEKLYEESPDA